MQIIQILTGENVELFLFLLFLGAAQVVVLLFQIFEVFVDGLAVGFLHKSILDIDLFEEGDHVLGLVVGVIDFFDSVENNGNYYFVWKYPRLLDKGLVALLDALDSVLQHVFGLAVHADANC